MLVDKYALYDHKIIVHDNLQYVAFMIHDAMVRKLGSRLQLDQNKKQEFISNN